MTRFKMVKIDVSDTGDDKTLRQKYVPLGCLYVRATRPTNSRRGLNTQETRKMAEFTWGESVCNICLFLKSY